MATTEAKTIGRCIRTAREKANLTQGALAELAGVSDETISRLERGTYLPTLATLRAFADALGMTLDELVRGAGKPKPLRAVTMGRDVRRLAERAAQLTPTGVRRLLLIADLLPTRIANAPKQRPSGAHRRTRP